MNFKEVVNEAVSMTYDILENREEMGVSSVFYSEYDNLCIVQGLEVSGLATTVLYRDILQSCLGSEFEVSNDCNSDGTFLVCDMGYSDKTHLDTFKSVLDVYFNMHKLPLQQSLRMAVLEFVRTVNTKGIAHTALLSRLRDSGVPILHQILNISHGYKELDDVATAGEVFRAHLIRKGWKILAPNKLVKGTDRLSIEAKDTILEVSSQYVSTFASMDAFKAQQPLRVNKIRPRVKDTDSILQAYDLSLCLAGLWCIKHLEGDDYPQRLGWKKLSDSFTKTFEGYIVEITTGHTKLFPLKNQSVPMVTIPYANLAVCGLDTKVIDEITECLAYL